MNRSPPSPAEDSALRYSAYAASGTLFIAFAGLQLWRRVPRFEWQNTLEAQPANRLYVRDLAQYYYLRGLAGLAGDIGRSADRLRARLDPHGYARLVCFGASMGGFAALLYGALLGADEVHAFSPVCYLPSRSLLQVATQIRTGNWRLIAKHIELRLDRAADHRRYFRARPHLQADNGRTRYFVYYGRHAPDVRNSGSLAGLPRVTLLPHDYPHHNLVGHLKNNGQLAPIVSGALTHPPSPVADS
ncbi:MAG: hypothetical protein KIS95_08085 [Anaerolineae bacterium]|uniref:hypothetical protein n=1 Tax=Promineifilum sp. TaxID=2664178 RepID=UPI001DEA2CBF|nr:hypothetical protein [Anaerolineales bacterium]MCB8934768.1 hypothetical protein [Promineifilum sp.]MCO5181541.1 hypothetical protein [Promineifilum sp.]MCW5847171.1 hypothetical protein [Anaerolineae bacterium]